MVGGHIRRKYFTFTTPVSGPSDMGPEEVESEILERRHPIEHSVRSRALYLMPTEWASANNVVPAQPKR